MKVPDVLNPLVGAWRLISWTSTAGDGTTTYPYGERAKGQLVYTPSGRMSAQLMRPDADFTRLADLDGMSALRELGRTTYFAYWGSYEVDDPAGTVTHHVEGSLAPSWVGTTQVRGFRFQGKDRLLITRVRRRLSSIRQHPILPKYPSSSGSGTAESLNRHERGWIWGSRWPLKILKPVTARMHTKHQF